MKATHTPGPWEVDDSMAKDKHKYCLWYNIKNEDHNNIAEVKGLHCGIENFTAGVNAKLIAAAPDLLQALVEMTERYVSLVESGDCGNWDPHEDKEVIQAESAIKKAMT